MRYFAYGSNMDPDRMKKDRKVRFSDKRVHGFLRKYVLKFNKIARKDAQEGEGRGNIVCDENRVVEGVLYEIVDSDLPKLDKAEGYPVDYDHLMVCIELEDGKKVRALAYIAQPNMIREGLKPTEKYLSYYLKAEGILSESYMRMLRAVETLD